MRFDPNLAFAYFERGEAYARKGANTLALADADEAIRLEPQLAEAHRLRGDVCAAGEDPRSGHRELHRSDPARSEIGRVLSGRAEAHSRKGEADRAEVDRREAERLESSVAR